MGLFHKNPSEANFAGGSKNVMESIQREHDTGTLIYLDPRSDFNTNSVITVAPNEQAIFIKNGEIYGVLPPGRHEVKTENYPILSRIRNMLSGGISTFTCQVYHVSTSETNIKWAASNGIQVIDYLTGYTKQGVQTTIYCNAAFRVCFNVREDENSSITMFLRIMGDRSELYPDDLSEIFRQQFSKHIRSTIARTLQERSKVSSINGGDSALMEFSEALTPELSKMLGEYGLQLVDFSLEKLEVDNTTPERQKYIDRINAAEINASSIGMSYDYIVQRELQKDAVNNPGGIAAAGAGLGMGLGMGGAFAAMGANAYTTPHPMGFAGQQPNPMQQQMQMQQQQMQQQAAAPQADPMEVLTKMKQMLDAGLITQQQYDAKVAEVMSRM